MIEYLLNKFNGIDIEKVNKLFESAFIEKFVFPLTLLIVSSCLINRSIEKYKHNNALDLQAESFYKEHSGNELKELLWSWSELVLNIEKIKEMSTEDFQTLFQKTFVYGSERTINLVSSYQQHNYKIEQNEDHNYKSLVYVAMISSSLKQDFTNQIVDPLQILKIKITDYDDTKIRKYYRSIEKEIKQ
ncbi:hypothetical protein [Staphylococcus delphini]|uniref:hypothetical protein n=1 Tax=Staphylococcus delphini TaxID=53344 RepID=UPI000BBB8184|nr:hypothetical protein [Staphylococcus delphini]PCF40207.1 hypothetical protein B5B99_03560 [Staphylococcus delphini]PCF53788.1 hypothetical protein B5C03_00530 [Staphylococcus delphini]PCF59138.1 hypothetical protein B5B97_01695 [Staphylococcus delphini]PCF60430.1 hypothetical protein B5C05_04480 [Staphylococcus delphini]